MTILTLPDRQEIDPRTQANELVSLFRLAEKKIKLVENLNQELSIPAINELRYAGFHMAQFLAGGDDASEQLSKAENHCKRAIYDAVEAGVTHQLEIIAQFQIDFRLLIIREIIPEYPEIQKKVIAAKKLILTPREPEERGAYYEQCSEYLEQLRAAQDVLDLNRDDLLKALKRMNRITMGQAATIFSLIVCVIAAVYAGMGYHKSNEAPSPPVVATNQAPTSTAPLLVPQPPPAKTANTR
ncbi:hypothetical protein K5D42_19755 [Pseudomonas cichorii]|nr:hypothetical protein [Pseudomonas cichorii]MBX8492106.1 hypothetical protein [Pseudomonas cichorii]MBX8571028.1 hypothetical protein [Pseudomonas cichorii]MBX8601850.1 hypothetical protein [Pseudomonas cichorii]